MLAYYGAKPTDLGFKIFAVRPKIGAWREIDIRDLTYRNKCEYAVRMLCACICVCILRICICNIAYAYDYEFGMRMRSYA